jgi:hypothetical protein
MNGFFVVLVATPAIWALRAWFRICLTLAQLRVWAFPPRKVEYHPDVLEAAEFDECDPEDIIWCSDCRAYHKGWW